MATTISTTTTITSDKDHHDLSVVIEDGLASIRDGSRDLIDCMTLSSVEAVQEMLEEARKELAQHIRYVGAA